MRRRDGAPRRQLSRPRLRKRLGCTVATPGLYVWEATGPETTWARELADYARALRRPPRLR